MNTSSTCTFAKLSVCGLGIALGLTWGLAVLILGVLALYWKIGIAWVNVLSSIYVGFDVTLKGIIAGTLWATIDAFILGVVIALIYNLCVKRCGKHKLEEIK